MDILRSFLRFFKELQHLISYTPNFSLNSLVSLLLTKLNSTLYLFTEKLQMQHYTNTKVTFKCHVALKDSFEVKKGIN